MINDKAYLLAREISAENNQDVYLLNAEFMRPLDFDFIKFIRENKSKENALLILVTPGGDADVAYKIARCMQNSYQDFVVFVSGWCKSAGTLCAIGATRLVMSEDGELGPLDVQIGRKDDIVGYESGLEIDTALGSLKSYVFQQFEETMLSIIAKSDGRVSINTAAQISANLAIGLFSQIYSQIDPTKMGEVARSMMIARDYGYRLTNTADNLISENGLDLLVSSYCSHSFVIDFREACSIFRDVKAPDEKLRALCETLGKVALFPVGTATVLECLSTPRDVNDPANLDDALNGDQEGAPHAEQENGSANSDGDAQDSKDPSEAAREKPRRSGARSVALDESA